MEVVREYCDAGKSDKNITGRPEFTQMLQDVANDHDGVNYIFWCLNYLDLVEMLLMC